MKIAAGIITETGGRTCHAAIVSRELGIPTVIGCPNATAILHNGDEITLDCHSGEVGYIYKGIHQYKVLKHAINTSNKPSCDIYVNIGDPDQALKLSQNPLIDGVGLARLEFIINNSIQIHPLALVHPEKVTDPSISSQIYSKVAQYFYAVTGDKKFIPSRGEIPQTEFVQYSKQFFVEKLAQEAGTIAASFYPRPVIIRLSDFKSNEYRQLIGGSFFEPIEENPMIGFRGASRYSHSRYIEAFELECRAMKRIREHLGLTNVRLMIPFVRTVPELKKVIDVLARFGLEQGKNELEIFMMVEVPSNVLLIDDFAQIVDGFSIGSNDLTQCTLAVDRDSALVSPLFDERNPAVKKMLEMAILGAKKRSTKIGICGQAPSDYPEIAKFLLKLGIDSISLNSDAVMKTSAMLSSISSSSSSQEQS